MTAMHPIRIAFLVLPASAATVACVSVERARPDATAVLAADQPIEFSVTSWGLPQQGWTLSRDGSILVETKAEGQPFRNYDLDQQRGVLLPADAGRVRAIVNTARAPLPACTVVATDGPSVVISWGDEQSGIYMGCAEKELRDLIVRLFEADEIVRAAVADAPFTGKRHIGS